MTSLTAAVRHTDDDIFLHEFHRLVKELSRFLLLAWREEPSLGDQLVVADMITRLVRITAQPANKTRDVTHHLRAYTVHSAVLLKLKQNLERCFWRSARCYDAPVELQVHRLGLLRVIFEAKEIASEAGVVVG